MLRDRVAAYYRSRGYRVQQAAKITGISGAVHAVDLWAEGPLGNLAVFLGDAGGIEGPELSALRRSAKDLGATPVVAPGRDDSRVRALAAQLGVVVLDTNRLGEPPDAVADPVWGDGDPAWPQPAAASEPTRADWPLHSRVAGRRPGEPIQLEQEPAAGRSLSDQVLDRLTGAPEPSAPMPRQKPARGFGWLRRDTPGGFDWLRAGSDEGAPETAPGTDASATDASTKDAQANQRASPAGTGPMPVARRAAPATPDPGDDRPGPGHWVVDPRRVDDVLARHGEAPPVRSAPTRVRPPAPSEPATPTAPVEPAWVPQPDEPDIPDPGHLPSKAARPRRQQPRASRAEALITAALWVIAAALAGLLVALLFL